MDNAPRDAATKAGQLERTVQSLAKMHAEHYRSRTHLQRRAERLTSWLGAPPFILAASGAALAWMLGNVVVRLLGGRPLDPPPFEGLQITATLFALFTALLILATQRREGVLAERRAQLTLELASLSEQKIAKVIQLLQEQRRDNPIMANRTDVEAEEMAAPADPQHVLDRIVETHDEI
ncbi:MAG: DUF1003 domain-containing protein [Caulobacteraceae bacterium]|nr:DUF1003 domain-containing protein [Caulobacteraceae bacterium]